MFVRYGMLGLDDDIVNSKEIWMCYACGECSEACPRQAEPGEFMASLRKYAIAKYDITGFGKILMNNKVVYYLATFLLAVFSMFFVFSIKPENLLGSEPHTLSRWIFDYVPYQVIHDMGIILMVFVAVFTSIGVIRMFFSLSKGSTVEKKDKKPFFKSIMYVVTEIITMKRYASCDSEEYEYWADKNKYVRPWAVHWTIMWGFIGLFVTTGINFLLDILYFEGIEIRDPNEIMFLPTRILGIIAGISMMYGSTLAIIYRLKKITKTYSITKLADWMFLSFIWLAGFSGFLILILVMFRADNIFSQTVFILHIFFSLEIIVLAIFSKFAHAVYRPIALYFYARDNK